MKVKKRLKRVNALVYLICFVFVCATVWAQDTKPTYVGSDACQSCHETEYKNFKAYAKKAQSYKSIREMKKGLTEAEFRKCFECHTTGYGKPGGFRSEHETPHLMNAGCEVCHGPGSHHIKTEELKDIKGSLTAKDCDVCHSSERVKAFDYKPLIHGGAH